MGARVKLSDVAARAGVSPAAASMALNGLAEGNLAPATRDRIIAAAAELDYAPDMVAQSLRRQKTHAVGLITDSIASSPFAGRLLAGAMDEATEHGYALLIVDSQNHRDREERAIGELARRRVDGLIYATMGLEHLAEAPATRLPLVLANCWTDDHTIAVIPDETRAGEAAASYLTGLGHRRLAMVAGLSEPAGPLRTDAFVARARAAGMTPTIRTIDGDWSIEAGYHAGIALLTAPDGRPFAPEERPSAVWGVNDRVATGVLLAATRLGLDVPGDLSVMGMDDQEALADCIVPALTTLALPHRRLGETAASLLLRLLEPPDEPLEAGPRKLECPLIVRASTAPPAGGVDSRVPAPGRLGR